MTEFTLPSAGQFERIIEIMAKKEQVGPRDDIYNSPGPQYLVAGNKNAGFFGFVKPSEFGLISDGSGGTVFNGSSLAQAVGISQGALMEVNTPWMKFSWNGKILFVPLKQIRRSISWDSIYQAGAGYGTGKDISDGEAYMLENDSYYNPEERVTQNANVTVDGKNYIVRLMRGAASDPQDSWNDSDRGSVGPENEWNHLILPLHERAPDNFNYNVYAGTPTDDWDINLTDEDLRTHYLLGLGSYSWCQEYSDWISEDDNGEQIRRVYRGGNGVSYLSAFRSSYAYGFRGWRPVLELS